MPEITTATANRTFLFQNTNGQAAIWLINGTTPTAEVLVGNNPGPTWHIHAAS